jgi:Meiotically up-regulated gene 113
MLARCIICDREFWVNKRSKRPKRRCVFCEGIPEPKKPKQPKKPRRTLEVNGQYDFQPKWGFVYFIQCSVTGLIKIGKSDDAISRFRGMESQSSTALELLKTVRKQDPYFYEHAIHEKFTHLRDHGEWFKPAKELLEFIEAYNENTELQVNFVSNPTS